MLFVQSDSRWVHAGVDSHISGSSSLEATSEMQKKSDSLLTLNLTFNIPVSTESFFLMEKSWEINQRRAEMFDYFFKV